LTIDVVGYYTTIGTDRYVPMNSVRLTPSRSASRPSDWVGQVGDRRVNRSIVRAGDEYGAPLAGGWTHQPPSRRKVLEMTAAAEIASSNRPNALRLMSTDSWHDRGRATELVATGDVIGASFGSVYGLVADGMRPDLAAVMDAIKGQRRQGRPLSVCLPAALLSQLIDPVELHPSIRSWALDGEGLARTLSSLALLRVPIREVIARELPAHLLSYVDGVPYLQSLDPTGMPGLRDFMDRLWTRGIMFPAITSMNASGQPEIVEFAEAALFSRAVGLPALVDAPQSPRAKGSLTILELGPDGVRAVRHGTVPVAVLQRVVERAIVDATADEPDFAPVRSRRPS
jgi:tRNA A37 threonylcarbamoyladenosine synthetase subunit TsaC/SUA5/YrdC